MKFPQVLKEVLKETPNFLVAIAVVLATYQILVYTESPEGQDALSTMTRGEFCLIVFVAVWSNVLLTRFMRD